MCLLEPMTTTGDKDVDRKRHISAPDESHSDSESTSLMSQHQLASSAQLLPRPRSSASLIDVSDNSTHTTTTSVEQLGPDTLVCTVTRLCLLHLFPVVIPKPLGSI